MSVWDDEAGYDRDDPKHPSFAERWLDHIDLERKRLRENPEPVTCAYEDVDESAGAKDAA